MTIKKFIDIVGMNNLDRVEKKALEEFEKEKRLHKKFILSDMLYHIAVKRVLKI